MLLIVVFFLTLCLCVTVGTFKLYQFCKKEQIEFIQGLRLLKDEVAKSKIHNLISNAPLVSSLIKSNITKPVLVYLFALFFGLFPRLCFSYLYDYIDFFDLASYKYLLNYDLPFFNSNIIFYNILIIPTFLLLSVNFHRNIKDRLDEFNDVFYKETEQVKKILSSPLILVLNIAFCVLMFFTWSSIDQLLSGAPENIVKSYDLLFVLIFGMNVQFTLVVKNLVLLFFVHYVCKKKGMYHAYDIDNDCLNKIEELLSSAMLYFFFYGLSIAEPYLISYFYYDDAIVLGGLERIIYRCGLVLTFTVFSLFVLQFYKIKGRHLFKAGGEKRIFRRCSNSFVYNSLSVMILTPAIAELIISNILLSLNLFSFVTTVTIIKFDAMMNNKPKMQYRVC